jgi:hypothetical protein
MDLQPPFDAIYRMVIAEASNARAIGEPPFQTSALVSSNETGRTGRWIAGYQQHGGRNGHPDGKDVRQMLRLIQL